MLLRQKILKYLEGEYMYNVLAFGMKNNNAIKTFA